MTLKTLTILKEAVLFNLFWSRTLLAVSLIFVAIFVLAQAESGVQAQSRVHWIALRASRPGLTSSGTGWRKPRIQHRAAQLWS